MEVWKNVKLPKGRVLIPGVISHATNVVEHPELIAPAPLRYAEVRRARECDREHRLRLCPRAVHRRVHPSIMWAKLEALVAGARIASQKLWSAPRKAAAARQRRRAKPRRRKLPRRS